MQGVRSEAAAHEPPNAELELGGFRLRASAAASLHHLLVAPTLYLRCCRAEAIDTSTSDRTVIVLPFRSCSILARAICPQTRSEARGSLP